MVNIEYGTGYPDMEFSYYGQDFFFQANIHRNIRVPICMYSEI